MIAPQILTLLPVRSFDGGKTRLSSVLSADERKILIAEMLKHVINCTLSHPILDCRIVSEDVEVLNYAKKCGAGAINIVGANLNAALRLASQTYGGISPILVIHADLPCLQPADLDAMLALRELAEVIAARDKTGAGTNALLMASPHAVPFVFGRQSLRRFEKETIKRGLRFLTCHREGLAQDIDYPDDLALLRHSNNFRFPS